MRLNLGCAKNHEPGFVQLDVSPRVGADVVHDLETTPLPFPDATFDCVLGSHVFEHIVRFVPLVRDLHRILKPGGFLLSVTPYGSSDEAWDNPFHVRYFGEHTWHYFNEALYQRPNHAGYGDFGIDFTLEVVETTLVPYSDEDLAPMQAMLHRAPALPGLDAPKRFLRNVIHEIHVALRKPDETKGRG
jgi:SAM-dependent methyltransferase